MSNFDKMEEIFTKHERKLLIELICNEQTHMIMKDHTKYDSSKYKDLEIMKIKIKDMWGESMILTFLGGVFVGGIIGIGLVAICTISKENNSGDD